MSQSKWAGEEDDAGAKNAGPSEAPRRGPRRRRVEEPNTDAEESNAPPAAAAEKEAPRRTTGGWGLDGGSAPATRAEVIPDVLHGGRRQKRSNNMHFEEDDTGIMLIPDLEEGADDDIMTQIAKAPKNTTRKVQSLRELDHEIRHTVASAAEGLDLSLLTRDLVPLAMLREDDTAWEFDALLQEVTQEFHRDTDRAEAVAAIFRKGLGGGDDDIGGSGGGGGGGGRHGGGDGGGRGEGGGRRGDPASHAAGKENRAGPAGAEAGAK